LLKSFAKNLSISGWWNPGGKLADSDGFGGSLMRPAKVSHDYN
jgi:hypothetical protein